MLKTEAHGRKEILSLPKHMQHELLEKAVAERDTPEIRKLLDTARLN